MDGNKQPPKREWIHGRHGRVENHDQANLRWVVGSAADLRGALYSDQTSTYALFSIFGMGMFTNIANDQPQRNYFSSGIQLDLELVMFSLLKSTLSFGFARAYGPIVPLDQFMISLKLLFWLNSNSVWKIKSIAQKNGW